MKDNLSNEEKELLRAASEKDAGGKLTLREVDQESWIKVGNRKFGSSNNPEDAARYEEAYKSLLKRGLISKQTDKVFMLTTSGFEETRKLFPPTYE